LVGDSDEDPSEKLKGPSYFKKIHQTKKLSGGIDLEEVSPGITEVYKSPAYFMASDQDQNQSLKLPQRNQECNSSSF